MIAAVLGLGRRILAGLPAAHRRLAIALPAAALVLALVAPAADATLVFVRNPYHPVVFAAADDGSGAHRIGYGDSPRVTPDGQTVILLREGRHHSQNMIAIPAAGGAPHRLMTGWRNPFYLAISPDSGMVAALRGGELGPLSLVLIDLSTGMQNVVARGYFGGFSFSPDGTQLLYSRAARERFPLRSDIYRFDVPLVPALRYLPPVRITSDHRSLDPLWGPDGKIVFVKTLGAKRRTYGPKNELYLMNPQGGEVTRLTHTRVDPLLQGLYPTDWSADGSRLLAEFEGQDTSYAVTVNPRTGAQRKVGGASASNWFIGSALSADGRTILGSTGGFEPGRHNNVVTVPYGGGHTTVLARNAFEPDWSARGAVLQPAG